MLNNIYIIKDITMPTLPTLPYTFTFTQTLPDGTVKTYDLLSIMPVQIAWTDTLSDSDKAAWLAACGRNTEIVKAHTGTELPVPDPEFKTFFEKFLAETSTTLEITPI